MLFTIIALEILSIIGVIDMPKYTLERGKMFALPALFYGLNSVLALSALSHMNIALYGVLKRCVPLATMVFSVLILKKGWPSIQTIGSVLFLTLGCIIAGKIHFLEHINEPGHEISNNVLPAKPQICLRVCAV